MTVKARLFSGLDDLTECDISGWQLYEMMPGHAYPSTLLQYAREYAELSGASFDIVDYERSVYHFVPGAKIAGAILD